MVCFWTPPPIKLKQRASKKKATKKVIGTLAILAVCAGCFSICKNRRQNTADGEFSHSRVNSNCKTDRRISDSYILTLIWRHLSLGSSVPSKAEEMKGSNRDSCAQQDESSEVLTKQSSLLDGEDSAPAEAPMVTAESGGLRFKPGILPDISWLQVNRIITYLSPETPVYICWRIWCDTARSPWWSSIAKQILGLKIWEIPQVWIQTQANIVHELYLLELPVFNSERKKKKRDRP